MSQQTDAPNKGHDDEQHADDGETVTSLTEAQAHFETLEQRRETRKYRIADGKHVTFTVRALKADERDEVESIAAAESQKAEKRSRSGQQGHMDIWPVKKAQLEHGIVDTSLDDFSPNRVDHLKSLPTAIQEDLFTAIDELGQIEKEVLDGFQSVGEGS